MSGDEWAPGHKHINLQITGPIKWAGSIANGSNVEGERQLNETQEDSSLVFGMCVKMCHCDVKGQMQSVNIDKSQIDLGLNCSSLLKSVWDKITFKTSLKFSYVWG